MTYNYLVAQVSEIAGHPPATVRDVLLSLPDVLLGLDEQDKVRTPMGVFRIMRRAPRNIRLPNGSAEVTVPSEMVVKLKAGTRLRRPPV